MYSYLHACFPEQGYDALAHRYLRIAAAATRRSAIALPGLLGGTAGLALTLRLAGGETPRYHSALASAHERLCDQVLARAWRRPAAAGVASSDFDIVAGAAGILAYLVLSDTPSPAIQQAVEHLLAYLLWLGEPGQPPGKERWYIPSRLLPNELHHQAVAQGSFNCGLAHGIPGPLAALSLAWLAGYRYPRLRETIASLADWIAARHSEQGWGIDWPDGLPPEAATSAQRWRRLPPTRAGWCYGAPGVARILWLAGCALEDDALRHLAIEAIEAALRRPAETRGLASPAICHGLAGLLQICLRFAHECQSAAVREAIPTLTGQLLQRFDSGCAPGFRAIEMGRPLDDPGWLTGAPGVAMVLLATATDEPPAWDRALVIA